MGRYIRGSNGFQYKYIYGRQSANIMYLGRASGAGHSGLLPVFRGSYAFELNRSIREGDGPSIPCIPLLRAIIAEGVARGSEIESLYLPPSGDVLEDDTTEFLQYALGENIGEVLWRIDSQCLVPLVGLHLEGYGGYSIDIDEYPKLITWVNGFLPANRAINEKKLAALREKQLEEYFGILEDVEEFMPFMALCILAHAARKKLTSFSATEIDPEIEAENFWGLAKDWQYSEGLFDEQEKSPRERFLRGLVLHFGRKTARAIEELNAAEAGGEARATRYLDLLLKRKKTMDAVPPPAEPLSLAKASIKKAAAKPKAAGGSAKKKAASPKKKAGAKTSKAPGSAAKKTKGAARAPHRKH